MTLAAKERSGESFFTNSPAAYFIDNLKEQAAGRRTPPDWWRELRKEEERRKWQADREERSAATSECFYTAFDAYLQTEAREAFHRVMDRIFQDLKAGGQADHEARRNASDYRPNALRAPLPGRAPGVERRRPKPGRRQPRPLIRRGRHHRLAARRGIFRPPVQELPLAWSAVASWFSYISFQQRPFANNSFVTILFGERPSLSHLLSQEEPMRQPRTQLPSLPKLSGETTREVHHFRTEITREVHHSRPENHPRSPP